MECVLFIMEFHPTRETSEIPNSSMEFKLRYLEKYAEELEKSGQSIFIIERWRQERKG